MASRRELSACDHIDGLVDRLLPIVGSYKNAAGTSHHDSFSGCMSALVVQVDFRVTVSNWLSKELEIVSTEDFWDLQANFSSKVAVCFNVSWRDCSVRSIP